MNLREAFNVPVPTIILAEGEFGKTGGKTANGVAMHSEIFDARAIIDSETAGRSARETLGKSDTPDIPIVKTLDEALEEAPEAEVFVIGVASAGGKLPESWVSTIQDAIRNGCDVVSGLHVFLNDDEEWRALADEHDAQIFDVRKTPVDNELRVGDGSIDDVDAKVILTMGTDCAVGKRTTTFELYKAAKARDLDAGWVATGQTGIMTGAHRGVVIDRVPADFTAGVVEDMVIDTAADNDIVFVEGQGCLSHRAYSGVTLSILHGAWPDAVVLADDPARSRRTHFEQFSVEGIAHERALIESAADTTVAAISTWGDPTIEGDKHSLPAANVYEAGGPAELFAAVESVLGVPV